jgi:hypothetical protein
VSGVSAKVQPVCAKYGEGATVAVDLRCPRFNCGQTRHGTAIVVNEYGVRDPIPARCECGVSFRVERIVDIELEAAAAGGSGR